MHNRFVPIPGFEKYLINDEGKVWSIPRFKVHGGFMRPWIQNGYPKVTLYKTLKDHTKIYIHRLVLLSFVGPCPEGREGCHKDGNRHNNSLSNLYWGTKSDNARDAVRHGTTPIFQAIKRGEDCGSSKLTADQVNKLRSLWKSGGYRKTDLANLFHISQTHAGRLVNNKSWTHLL